MLLLPPPPHFYSWSFTLTLYKKLKQNYTPKLTQLKQSSSMNSNNRIIIKVKKTKTPKIKVRPSDKCYEQMRQRMQKEADAIVVDWEDFIKTLDA